ncbi:MBL fold metallo-hydrolase [Hafnia paralvei]|uniref:MBL fold metallo-hydrolase n=1 Tax=Hafnia paralvei TaxID=546367 RepID=UPI00300CE12F
MQPTIAVKPLVLSLILAGASFATQAKPLEISVYNPGATSLFPVSSELITSDKEAVLIDAQFEKKDANALINMIKKSGKTLTTIYISHGDPDFYFGLDTLLAAYPQAKVVATQPTVAHIKATQQAKLQYWGPLMKDQAPAKVITPDVLSGNEIVLEGQKLIIQDLDSASPDRTYVWIPSLKAVVGGVLVSANQHIWTADTQTKASRENWIMALDRMQALHPETVVPGHYLGTAPKGDAAIVFSRDYLKKFEQVLSTNKNSQAVIHEMKKAYPTLKDAESLELSAKVNTGEMKW